MEALIPESLSIGWAVALVAAAFVTAAISAAFGIGGGVAMLAVMLAVLPPAIVLPIHAIVQTGSNLGRAATLRRHVHWPVLGWFSIGTVIGIVAASLVFVALPTAVLSTILGLFILWTVWGPRLVKRAIPNRRFFFVGLGASFCTMFVGATGPMVAAFWDVARMGRLGVVGTHAASMVVQHAAKVAAFGAIGFDFGDWLPMVIAMLIAGQVGTQVGAHLLARMPERVFSTGFKLVLTALALRLLWSAWN